MIPALLAFVAASISQDAIPDMLTDPAIWGREAVEVAIPDPLPPIFVDEWRVLRGGEAERERELARYLLDPEGFEPDGWEELADPSKSAGVAAAFARVHVDTDQVRMARLPGVRCLGLRGELFHGDPERKGHRGVPVALRAGVNELVVFGASEGFELELWSPGTRAVIADWAVVAPPVTRELATWAPWEIVVPVFNASVEALSSLHVHYGSAVPDQDGLRPTVSEWQDGGWIAPLGLSIRQPYFASLFAEVPGVEVASATSALYPITVYDSEDLDAARCILRVPLAEPGTIPLAKPDTLVGVHPDEYDPSVPTVPTTSFEHADWLVVGTLGSESETQALLARARFDQQRLWYATGHAPEIALDHSFREGPRVRVRRLVAIYGNQDTNATWEGLVGDTPDLQVRRGSARLGEGPTREGNDLSGLALRPRADAEGSKLSVLVLFDTGLVGARRGAQLDPRTLKRGVRDGLLDPDHLQPR